MACYRQLGGTDEDHTLSRLRGLRSDLIDLAITAHHGHVHKRTGDGSVIELRSAVDALRRAIEVQNGLIEHNTASQGAEETCAYLPRAMFSPGICWSGLSLNRWGCEVDALQTNS